MREADDEVIGGRRLSSSSDTRLSRNESLEANDEADGGRRTPGQNRGPRVPPVGTRGPVPDRGSWVFRRSRLLTK